MSEPIDTPAPAPDPVAASKTKTKPEAVDDLALDDWCAAKSRTLGRRVEALSAFWKQAQAAGMGRATRNQFESAYQDFLRQPA